MKRLMALCLILALLLSGCAGWTDGHYAHVTPYEDQEAPVDEALIPVSNYTELCNALAEMTRGGVESGILSVTEYDQTLVAGEMYQAVQQTLREDPIAAYAVEEIEYELGSSGGAPAIAVTVHYLHDRAEIRKIRQVRDMEEVKTALAEALDQCAAGIVLYLENYQEADIAQWVEDYGNLNPHKVMEIPQATLNIYPETGTARVLEIKFLYQTSRETLRYMQIQVGTIFEATVDYVSVTAEDREKFSQIYSLLMERSDSFRYETSITPTYSLLFYGVGDAKAFAVVYAAMCREAGLESHVLTGTRDAEPWFWNMIQVEGEYLHVDLIRCAEDGLFRLRTDEEMTGYVWHFNPEQSQTLPSEE